MSKGPYRFKETDIRRVFQVAHKMGVGVKLTITNGGDMVIEAAPPIAPATAPTTVDLAADEWKVAP
jgi:hypothetical protein